jgi:hypothetical protein
MKTEYLITFDSKDCICASVDKFKSLLTTHSSISFNSKSLIKFNEKEFQYQLALGTLTDGSIYYDLTLENNEEQSSQEYSELLREIRKICAKISNRNIIVLHDGVGEKYCELGYPLIYKTENLMRKLISKFMAISIGYDWTDLSIPKEVMDSVRTEVGKKEKSNFLHEVDFIQLSTFLFKTYTKADSTRFIDSIKEKADSESIKISELKQYVPFTNWEKYFSKSVNCDSEYLKSKWEKLYDIRCKIAHCKGLSKQDYNDLVSISNDVCGKIQTALDSVGDIHIEADEREELAENLSGAANDNAANFIAKYNKMSQLIQYICELSSSDEDVYYKHETNKTNIRMQAKYLCTNKGLINAETSKAIENSQYFRNNIVHKVGIIDISEPELLDQISTVDSIINELLILNVDEIEKLKGIDQKRNQQ